MIDLKIEDGKCSLKAGGSSSKLSFDKVAKYFDGTKTMSLINRGTKRMIPSMSDIIFNNIEDHESTIAYIQENKIKPYCNNVDNIIFN